ncbi:MAG: cytochrome c oxidase assembly protein [Thermoleophilaceae bacterium]|nr:cytochrome c oxidase assembly protein [Thermoleophilaceae bacterium]
MGSVSPPMIVLLAIVTFAYFKRVHTLRGDSRRRVSGLRQVSFACSILLLVGEPLSPLGVWDELSFTIHMVEHLLIGDLAALLMVLGLTGPLIAPVMRNPVIDFLRPLANPIPALVFWIANLYFWHLPFAFEAALNSDSVHVVQHICFFSAGFNVWMAVFGPLPKPEWFGNIAKLVYIVVQRMAGVLLGNFLIFGGSVFYSNYETANNPLGMTALGDQSVAGAVMMAEGSFISFILLGWLFFKAASEGEKSQQLIEHAEAHGVEISQARSDRAAAAGTTDLLRERISSGAGLDKGDSSDLS